MTKMIEIILRATDSAVLDDVIMDLMKLDSNISVIVLPRTSNSQVRKIAFTTSNDKIFKYDFSKNVNVRIISS